MWTTEKYLQHSYPPRTQGEHVSTHMPFQTQTVKSRLLYMRFVKCSPLAARKHPRMQSAKTDNCAGMFACVRGNDCVGVCMRKPPTNVCVEAMCASRKCVLGLCVLVSRQTAELFVRVVFFTGGLFGVRLCSCRMAALWLLVHEGFGECMCSGLRCMCLCNVPSWGRTNRMLPSRTTFAHFLSIWEFSHPPTRHSTYFTQPVHQKHHKPTHRGKRKQFL